MAYKGVHCEFNTVNLLTDEPESSEHLKRNPLGYVPVLELIDDNGESRYLGESTAIIEWLEETRPKPSLLPQNPLSRARVRQLAEVINAGTQPLQNPNVSEFHSTDPEERKRWAQHWIRKGLHAYETLVHESAGRFSFGNQLTVADLYLIPQCYNALRQGVEIAEEFPRLQRIWDAAKEEISYQASEPERFKPE